MSLSKWIPLLLITPLAIAIDQVAKIWVINNLYLYDPTQIADFLYPYLQITRTTNTGFAFGLASGGNLIILNLAIIITGVLLWMYYQTQPNERIQRMAFALVIGGAIGNIIDRIRLGHVVDFVHVTIFNINNVSNFADHFVVIGVIILILDSFFGDHDEAETTNQLEASSAEG
ncbi:MAG: signal peptidase II [Chloroflexota bacterium]